MQGNFLMKSTKHDDLRAAIGDRAPAVHHAPTPPITSGDTVPLAKLPLVALLKSSAAPLNQA